MDTTRPPQINLDELDPRPLDTPLKPNLLGYTLASWQRLAEQHGPVLMTQIDGVEQLILCGHDADLHAWKTPDDWLYGPPSTGGVFFSREMGPAHITQLDGPAHRRSRKLLLPGFGISAMGRDISSIAQTLSQGFKQAQDKPLNLHNELCFLYAKSLSRSQLKTTVCSA